MLVVSDTALSASLLRVDFVSWFLDNPIISTIYRIFRTAKYLMLRKASLGSAREFLWLEA